MNVLQTFEFDYLNQLSDKVEAVIREKIEKVEESDLAYKATKRGNKYILEVLIETSLAT